MINTLMSLVVLFVTATATLAADAPKEGYEPVSPAQPTGDPSKVEVIEFFWYGCPHCYHFEPDLNAWLKSKPANVNFIRQPAVFNEIWEAHAKAFFTAEALGVLDKVHADFYDTIQNGKGKKVPLTSEEELAKFFAAHGVAEADFEKAYKSFTVDAKVRQAKSMAERYGVKGTPALIVNGKYRIGGLQSAKMIEILNTLIAQETNAKSGK
jgi:protein dithiol oxidoreductase (disulfide-forming)